MAKVSFRMASASRESVFGVQTSTARKNHRSGHTEGRVTTTPSGCCVRKGTPCGHSACTRAPFPVEAVPRVPQHPPDEMPDEGATTGTSHDALLDARASEPAASSCAPALNEDHASAGAKSARTALPHPWKAAVKLSLSSSMHSDRRPSSDNG